PNEQDPRVCQAPIKSIDFAAAPPTNCSTRSSAELQLGLVWQSGSALFPGAIDRSLTPKRESTNMYARLAAAATMLLVCFANLAIGFGAGPRPNIVLVFIDDMGWGDLSCFGNTQAKTPHLDWLAAEGIR